METAIEVPGYVTASVLTTALFAALAVPIALARAARVAGLSSTFAVPVGAGLVAWLVVTAVLALAGVYRVRADQGLPATTLALVIAIVASVLAIRLIPGLRAILAHPASEPALIWLQVWRIDGLAVLVLMRQGELPGLFAIPAGIGDLAIGLTAPLVARTLHRRRLAIGWNICGFAVLVSAVALAIMTTPGSARVFTTTPSSAAMTAFLLAIIPTFLVTLSNPLHLASLRYLLASRHAQKSVAPVPMR